MGALCALLLAVQLVPWPAGAQERDEARPFTKSELVRLLVDSSVSQEEIAEAVSRACLTFEPDEEDLSDLERAGAGPEVVQEVTACARRAAPVRLSRSDSVKAARAGETVVFEVRAIREEAGVEGLDLVLVEAGEPVASTRTDGRGRARFRIPGGTSVGRRTFRVRTASGSRDEEVSLALDVRPAPPDRATVSIGPAEPDSGTTGVSVRVRDTFGNPVPGVTIGLAADSAPAGDGAGLPEARTGPDGAADFRLSERQLPGGERLLVLHGSDTLAVSRDLPRLARADPEGDSAREAPDTESSSAGPENAGEEAPAETEGNGERPTQTGAEEALASARLDLRQERPLDAVTWFRRAVELRPEDGEAWGGLGRAWLAAGEPALARQAFVEGRRRARDSTAVGRAAERVDGLPPWGRVRVLGGGTWRGPRIQDFGSLAVEVHPGPAVSLRAGYESTLFHHHASLVRGGSDVASAAGGVAVAYGPDRLVTTELSVARLDHGSDLRQYVYGLENELRFSAGGRPLRWRIGGTLGRWWDRDDWLVSTEVSVPMSTEIFLVPSVHVGETSGTAVDALGRRPASVRRGQLAVDLEPLPGWKVRPTVVYGRVSPVEEDLEAGELLEGRIQLSVPLSPTVRLLLQGRHQRPPFTDSFTDAAVGLSYDLR